MVKENEALAEANTRIFDLTALVGKLELEVARLLRAGPKGDDCGCCQQEKKSSGNLVYAGYPCDPFAPNAEVQGWEIEGEK